MGICCVVGCSNRTSRKTDHQKQKEVPKRISYHRFPDDPILRKSWIDAIRREDWIPSQHSVICSEHFSDSFLDVSALYTKLSKTAVPTIFPSVDGVRNVSVQHGLLNGLLNQSLPDTNEPSDPTFLEPTVLIIESSDVSTEHNVPANIISDTEKLSTPNTSSLPPDCSKTPLSPSCKIDYAINYKYKLSRYKQKIRCLQQKTRRQTKKIEKLQSALKELKSNKCSCVGKKKRKDVDVKILKFPNFHDYTPYLI